MFASLQVSTLPVRTAPLSRVLHADSVHDASDDQSVFSLGRNLGTNQTERKAGRPQPGIVDEHDQPVRFDVLLRISGELISKQGGQISSNCGFGVTDFKQDFNCL